jgi:hypothetical protein
MAHSYSSNAAEIGQHLVDDIRTFGFTSTHEGKALGWVIIDNITEGIALRSADRQCDGQGTPWPMNSEKRMRMKIARYGYCMTNKDTGQMLSATSLKGKVAFEQHLVTIEYGTREPSSQPKHGRLAGAVGRPVAQRVNIDGDIAAEPITDIDKATSATEQGRGYFELDQAICDENFADFSAALGAHIANRGP